MAKPRGTDGSLLASLPWTLLALAVAAAPHLPYLPFWVTGASVACAVWRFAIEKRRKLLPSPWIRGVLALGCFLGVLATYDTISGVGPGTALLAIMAALKLLETRKRRDQFVLLFISIFLVMAALLREQHLWSLPYMIVSLVVTMAAWLRMSTPAALAPRQSIGNAARLVAYAAPLAIAMWVFFPRIATPFWSVPIDTSSGVTGLSDTMSPGDISQLSQSDAVAFRVRFNGRVPAPRDRYWRALVLHRFNGRTWTGSDPTPDYRFRDRIDYVGASYEYDVTLEPTRTQWVMALDVPERWWNVDRVAMSRTQGLWRVLPVDQRLAYSVRSYPEARIDAGQAELARNWYLQLPDDRNPRTLALAREMRGAAGSDDTFIDDVLEMFNVEEYFYTLEPPALGSNPVDRFLFETRQGFCEHYASAFTVLMRAAGIPARVVVGYQGGETNPLGDYMIIRQADAHAWAEVWLPGAGWRRIDPTAAVAPERIDAGRSGAMFDGTGEAWGLSAPSRLAHQLGLTWDALNARWNEFVLGYGPENQERFMRWLGLDNPDWQNLLLTLIAAVAVLTTAIHVVLILRFRPPREDRAKKLYLRFIRRTGVEPRRGETPLAFVDRLADQVATEAAAIAREVTNLYLEARYGEGDSETLALLDKRVRSFRPRPA